MTSFLLFALLTAAAALALYFFGDAAVRIRATQLLDASIDAEPPGTREEAEAPSRLERWLAKAGYRGPSAASVFWGSTACGATLGLLGAFLFVQFKVMERMTEAGSAIPGEAGVFVGFIAAGAPYLFFVLCASAPWMIVRASRRRRVEAIEEDLAPSLELLATLAEAGLGFDSALARIQDAEGGRRPLLQEFEIYQRDTQSGIPRRGSLRRLAERADVQSVSIFVSALIQAEQIGSSLAETLRTQADDLRDRRKMRALLLAQGLPVKLAFPLMACFLPGIFYSTLGPVLSQLVDVVDGVIRRR